MVAAEFALVCILTDETTNDEDYAPRLPASRANFGVKPVDERSGPARVHCPRRILERLTPTANGVARSWRAATWGALAELEAIEAGRPPARSRRSPATCGPSRAPRGRRPTPSSSAPSRRRTRTPRRRRGASWGCCRPRAAGRRAGRGVVRRGRASGSPVGQPPVSRPAGRARGQRYRRRRTSRTPSSERRSARAVGSRRLDARLRSSCPAGPTRAGSNRALGPQAAQVPSVSAALIARSAAARASCKMTAGSAVRSMPTRSRWIWWRSTRCRSKARAPA